MMSSASLSRDKAAGRMSPATAEMHEALASFQEAVDS